MDREGKFTVSKKLGYTRGYRYSNTTEHTYDKSYTGVGAMYLSKACPVALVVI